MDIGRKSEGSAKLKTMSSKLEMDLEPDVDVVDVRPMRGYRLWVKFADGKEGIADLSDVPHGEGYPTPWHSMREFKKVSLRDRTATWDTPDGGIFHFSPFTLYVKAGLATWDVFMEPRGEDPVRAVSVMDCEEDTLWVELDTGEKGYIKVPGDLPDSLEEFTLPDRPKGESFIVTSGDIVWKNEFWLDTEDVEKVLTERRNGLAV